MRRSHRLQRPPRRGFTLIEIVVALAISALVILAGRVLLESLGAAADRIDRAASDGAGDANGERLLRALVEQIDVGIQGATFAGDEQSAQFTTWCQSPRGWGERCRLTLSIETQHGMPTLTTTLPGNDRVVLHRARRTLRLLYLVDANAGGTWFVRWGSGLLAPRAIGVIADSDTLIVRVGERG